MSKTLYITHPKFNIVDANIDSILINDINIPLDYHDYHTSLGDLSPKDILLISKQFDKINFINTGFLTDSPIYKETIILLTHLSHQIPIENFIRNFPLLFTDDNSIFDRTNTPTLWVFGCSHSHGVGLSDDQTRYGNIISKSLGLPLKSITRPGSSTRWSLRHLINADIRPDDLVIWQLTTPERITVYNSQPCEVVLSSTSNKDLITVFNDDQIFFDHLSLIQYGVAFLRALNVKFVLTSIEYNSSLFYNFKEEYVKYKEYCYSPGFDVDHGADGVHFGEISHKNLALSILDHIHYNYG